MRIAPSLLAANFAALADEVLAVEAGGADSIHLDIMDGHFVPNISFGPAVIKALRQTTSLFYDVHLMLTHPQEYFDPFIDAGAQHISFHVEADVNISQAIAHLRDKQVRVGLVVNPDTPAEAMFDYLGDIDMALVMTVHPGFGGQSFMQDCMPKVAALREKVGPDFDIQVDGGVAKDTIEQAAQAGANVFVAGTSVFGQADRAAAITELRSLAQGAA